MRNVILAATLACVATIGLNCQGQVPADLPDNRQPDQQVQPYDIGIRPASEAETCPNTKADTLVVYSATWCAPCQVMRPQWKALRDAGYKVVYIDVDDPHKYDDRWDYQTTEFVSYVDSYEVKSVPTVRFYNSDLEAWLAVDGKPFEKTGYVYTKDIKKYLWKQSSSTD